MSVEIKVKRRYWTQVQKEAILRKYEQGEESLSDLARRHQIHPVQLYKWRRKMIEQKRAISANVLPDVKELLEELKQTKEENEYLKKALGEMAMDKQILKAANETADTYAEKQGLFVIRATGSSASIINKEDFKPKAF